jgi:hypothetical protein
MIFGVAKTVVGTLTSLQGGVELFAYYGKHERFDFRLGLAQDTGHLLKVALTFG